MTVNFPCGKAVRQARTIVEVAGIDKEQVDIFLKRKLLHMGYK